MNRFKLLRNLLEELRLQIDEQFGDADIMNMPLDVQLKLPRDKQFDLWREWTISAAARRRLVEPLVNLANQMVKKYNIPMDQHRMFFTEFKDFLGAMRGGTVRNYARVDITELDSDKVKYRAEVEIDKNGVIQPYPPNFIKFV